MDELLQLEPVVTSEEVAFGPATSSDNRFILANTEPISYTNLRHKCIVPVFSKDNELTISHLEFIDVVGEITEKFFSGEQILHPAIRVSHPIKGRTPDALNKPVEALLDRETTRYFERMAFNYEIPGINTVVSGNKLSLSVGGVRSLNHDNLYGKKSEEHFKVYIGFKNHVCINLCISTDGFLDDLRVMTVHEIFNRVFQLLTRFDSEKQINHLKTLSDYALTEHQFAQLVGRSRLYQYLPVKDKKDIPQTMPLSDSQVSAVAKDYYGDKSFCRSSDGSINFWKLYNLFTSATKSSYIDSHLDRTVGAFSFVVGLQKTMNEGSSSWFLS